MTSTELWTKGILSDLALALDNVNWMRQKVCAYVPGAVCDCKSTKDYEEHPEQWGKAQVFDLRRNSENNGCYELRQAAGKIARVLQALTGLPVPSPTPGHIRPPVTHYWRPLVGSAQRNTDSVYKTMVDGYVARVRAGLRHGQVLNVADIETVCQIAEERAK